MEELKVFEDGMVPVYETSSGEKVVYGTELHKTIGTKSNYREWIKRRISDVEAVDGEDYTTVEISTLAGGTPKKEHIIKLDIAKEMAMLERNEKGRKVSRFLNAIGWRKTMDNKVSVFKNGDLGLEMRTILNEDGSISVNAEDTAIGFGWVDTSQRATSGSPLVKIRWARMNKYSAECGFPRKWGKDDYIPESLFYMLAMKANNERAQKFQRWIAIDVVPAIRKTGSYGGISGEVRSFMEKQVQFNQEMLQKLSEIEVWRSENAMIDSFTECVKDESESVKRIKTLNSLVTKMAKACGWEKRFAFHRLYKTLEGVLNISLDDYLEIHQVETGNMDISTLEMLVEYNRLYETAVRLCTNTINGMKC